MTTLDGKTVYLVRHGQTEYNKQKRLQGWKDSPLSEEGKEQSRIMGEALKDYTFSRVWVSPLGRARQTADIMRELMGFLYDVTDDLREVSFGDWEGYTLPEINEKYPGQWDARQNDKWSYLPPGGESNKDAAARAVRMKERIEESAMEDPFLIVAHFAINRLIMAQCIGMEPEDVMRMNVPHTIIYRLKHENGKWRAAWQMADQLEDGFQDGWLPQYQSENQLIPKY